MSFLTTKSQFFFGTTVTADNFSLDFSEGGPEINGSLRIKSFTLSELITEVSNVLNAAGSQVYTVTLNRTTRKVTISAPGNFELLALTGSRVGTGIWATLGFSATDKTGSNSYTSENTAGSLYVTQAVLKDYTSAEDFEVKEYAKVNVAANGDVQVVTFGDGSRIEMNIWLITDKAGPFTGVDITPVVNAVEKTRELLRFMISKGRFEFMPDVSNPNIFNKCILEKTPESGSGTEYRLYEMKAKDFFETKDLQFRVVE